MQLIPTEELHAVLAVIYAMFLGGIIGLERELKSRPAGFRTHMLVAGAAAFLVSSTQLLVARLQSETGAGLAATGQLLNVDPLRMIEAVVAGVSFIGAGCIFASRNGDTVHGITTAASLLMVASIGLCAGLGYTRLAGAVTLVTLLVLVILKRLEHWIHRRTGQER